MAGEFKIKTGLILGPAPTQPVVSIRDTSISITADASSILSTGKAIYDFVNAQTESIEAYQDIQDASIDANWQRWLDSNRSGFLNQTDTSLSFNPSTFVFTLGDMGSGWSYYRDGEKYSIAGDSSIRLTPSGTPSADTYYITIDSTNGSLSVSTTPWSLSGTEILVAYVDFDSSNTPTYVIGEERHTMLIDRQMHRYLHETRGTQFVSGGTLTGPDIAAGDVTVTDASNAVGISATEIADEDLFQTLPALTRPNGATPSYFTFIRSGGILSDWAVENLPFSVDGGNIQYDNVTGMTAATDGKYVNSYIMFTNLSGPSGNPRFAILPGQGEYDTVDAAINENPASFNFTGLPIAEYVIAWQLTWEVSTGYSTTGNVALASAPKRIEVNATTASQVTTEDHNDLIGLQGGNTAERYHLTEAQWSDYIGKTDVDSSLSDIWDEFGNIETSIGNIETYWKLDGSTLVPKDESVDVQLSAIQIDTDGGAVTVIDMDVSSATAGTEESYAFNIDGTAIAKVYAEGNGSGGIREAAFKVLESLYAESSVYFTGIDESSQTKVLFYNPTSGEVTYDDPCTGINSVAWGDITGSLSSQTDLNNYLTDLSTNKQDDITFGTQTQVPYINVAGDDFEYGGLEFNKNTGSLFVKADQDTDSPSITLRDGSNNSSGISFNNATSSTTFSGGSAKRLQITFNNVCIGSTFSDTTTFLVKSASTGHVLSVFYNYNNDIVHRIAADGSVYFPLLAQSSQSKALYYNPANGLITYADPCTGESATWGNIDGDITSQNDLWTILNDLSTNKFDKSGGTITGDVTLTDASLILNTGNIGVGGGLGVAGDVAIGGNLTIDGSLFVVGIETLDVSNAFIHLNTGLVGTPPSWMQSGIVVERGDQDPYAIIFDEENDTFRIGISPKEGSLFDDASTQAVATRQDTPIDGGVSYWNSDMYRMDTSIHLRYSNGNLQVNNDISIGSQIFAPNLTQAGQPNIVFWNNTTGELTRGDASSLGFDTSTFLSLHDTPNSYLDGSAGAAVVINDAGNGLEFAPRIWREESNEVTLANENANVLFYENIEIEADSGVGTFVDKEVTSSSAENTEESYTFDIDGSTVAKIYGVSDGGGSLKEYGFVVETYQYMGDPNTNGSWRFYVNSSGDLVFEKRISGTWTEKGKFTE